MSEKLLVQLSVRELEALIRAAILELIREREEVASTGARLLDREALARALHVSVRQVDRLRKQGLPTLYLGEAARFDLPEVLAWLRGRRGGLRLVGGSHG